MNVFRRIRAFIRKVKNDRFLHNHNCRNWKEYNIKFDKKIDKNAVYVGKYYHGYPYIIPFTNTAHPIYEFIDYGLFTQWTGVHEILQWCEKNCKGKFRIDALCAIESTDPCTWWPINSLSNYVWFIAFEYEEDYNWTLLRWL